MDVDEREQDKQVVGSGVEEKVPQATRNLTTEAARASEIVTRAKELADKWVELAQSEAERVKMIHEEWDLLQSLVNQVKNMSVDEREKLASSMKEMGLYNG